MLMSMTGYGRGEARVGGLEVSVELRSVNHRGLDIRARMPGELAFAEIALQRMLKAKLGRGRVEARVELERSAVDTGPRLDGAQATRVYEGLEALRMELGVSVEITMGDVLTAPGLWVQRSEALDEAEALEALEAAVEEALEALNASRLREGEALTREMEQLLEAAEEAVGRASARAPERVEAYRARLEEHLSELTEGMAGLEPSRLAMEVALFADRVDVAEEIQRASAHVVAIRALIEVESETTACVGKKLDFYLQELGREANTMASKSRDADLTATAIALKSALESMREQAANAQ